MHIAQLNIPSDARWSEDAITVAGSWNGESGSASDLLNWNRGLFITGDDTLYVADTGNARIVIIHPNSTKAVPTISSGGSPNLYGGYIDVFVTKTNIYILDSAAKQVKIWDINRSRPCTFDENPTRVISIERADHFFVDPDGNVYITQRETPTVKCFLSDATNNNNAFTVAGDGTAGSDLTQLNSPRGLFVDEARSVYVADYDNNRIQKWPHGATSGMTVVGNGACGSNDRVHLCLPTLVVLDSNRNMYTVENGVGRIMRWIVGTYSGECIAACSGVHDLQSNNLYSTHAIAFDSQGSLYASDLFNNRVQKFKIIMNPSK